MSSIARQTKQEGVAKEEIRECLPIIVPLINRELCMYIRLQEVVLLWPYKVFSFWVGELYIYNHDL